MDPLAIEELAANLIGNYLASVRVAIALPAALQILTPFSIVEATMPLISFEQAHFECPGSARNPHVTLDMELQTVAFGEGRVDPTVDSAWNAALRRAILDEVAFLTYLQALSDADRTGWKLLSLVLQAGAVELDRKTNLRHRHSTVFMTFLID